jgi:hypothetical protein
MKHQGVEALLQPREIRKIYTDPALMAQYQELADEIRTLDWRAEIPPPVHYAALDHMREVLAQLKKDIELEKENSENDQGPETRAGNVEAGTSEELEAGTEGA